MKKFIISILITTSIVATTTNVTLANSNLTNLKEENINLYVESLYQNILKRNSDKDGYIYWSNRLVKRDTTMVSVLKSFLNSGEYKGQSNIEYVKSMYKTLLLRDGDLGGINYWVGELNKGHSKDYIIHNFINSDEFKNRVNDTTLIGSIEVVDIIDKNPNVGQALNDLYSCINERNVDKDGLNYWGNKIVNKELKPSEVISNILLSNESDKINNNSTKWVEKLYRSMYGRGADASGLKYWSQMLDNTKDKKNIIYEFSLNNEFKNHMKKYNLNEAPSNNKIEEYTYEYDYVDKLYSAIFNRNSDDSGRKYWGGKLKNKEITVSQLIKELMNSNEFINRKLNTNEFIDVIYKSILLRTPDTDGLNYWTKCIDNGTVNKADVVNNFINSNEFTAICKKYNLSKGVTTFDKNDFKNVVEKPVIIDYKFVFDFDEDPYTNKPKYLVLHHADASKATVQSIHEYHKSHNGWAGIGYHYYIAKDGTIYQGRQDLMRGAHSGGINKFTGQGTNEESLGICVEGAYENKKDKNGDNMPSVQKDAVIRLGKYLAYKYNLQTAYKHGDLYSTDCPGEKFPFDEIKKEIFNIKL